MTEHNPTRDDQDSINESNDDDDAPAGARVNTPGDSTGDGGDAGGGYTVVGEDAATAADPGADPDADTDTGSGENTDADTDTGGERGASSITPQDVDVGVTGKAGSVADAWAAFFDADAAHRDAVRDTIHEYNEDDEVAPVQIDYGAVQEFDADLAAALEQDPEMVIDACEELLREYAAELGGADEDAPSGVGDAVDVRIADRPRDDIRSLNSQNLDGTRLITVEGVVQKATVPRPTVREAVFECQRCGTLTRIPQQLGGDELQEPHECSGCERQGPFRINQSKSEWIDTQVLRVQESPEGLRGGETPRVVDVHVRGADTDAGLVDAVVSGDRVRVTGTYKSEPIEDLTPDTYIDANNITQESGGLSALDVTADDIQRIEEFVAECDAHPVEQVAASIAPSIYGREQMKRAIAVQLFGGVPKSFGGSEKRGDIHVLFVGDPGTGKSESIQFAADVMPRGEYTTGESASSVGLTAAVVEDDMGGGGWTIEPGVLVLADKGLAAVDELDKLGEDTDALHSALEQQQVSVSKAGKNTDMPARCALVAAANPEYGRWDTYEPIAEQIDIDPAILSRFDLIFAPKDEPDEEQDAAVAEHVIGGHQEAAAAPQRTVDDEVRELLADAGVDARVTRDSGSDNGEGADAEGGDGVDAPLSKDELTQYIAYARAAYDPELTDAAAEVLEDVYTRIRAQGEDEDAPVPVTARKLEGLVRLAEAFARMRLSARVSERDAERAAELVIESLQEVGQDPETGEFDADVVETGNTKSQRDRIRRLQDIIEEVAREHDGGAPHDAVVERAVEEGISESKVEHELETLKRKGDVFEPSSGEYRTT